MASKYQTPKRKLRIQVSSSCSSADSSPDEKRLKESNSPKERCKDKDEGMAQLELPESVSDKLDLILVKLNGLETKMESLSSAVKNLKGKVQNLEGEITSVKEKQKTMGEKFENMETNSVIVDEQIQTLISGMYERKEEIADVHKQVLYLEAYSRRENLKFEGITEKADQQSGEVSIEDTKEVLANFMTEVLGIEDAGSIEFQRVHRMGKPRNGNEGRTIIARFLRFSDRERVFRCGRKLKDTPYKMYEDLPKKIHELRKVQMSKLKKARNEGKRANFSKSEPDKLYIEGKYIKM